jgi:hypothetical protein
MAQAVLVKEDIEAGMELLRVLDAKKFPITGAAWIFFPDIEEWRLVMRSPRAERDLQSALLDIATAMDEAGDLRSRLDLSRIRLVPPNDRLLQAMGSAMQVQGLSNIRFSKSLINGIYIDDALIYRLAA